MAAALFATGPLGIGSTPDGPYANTYMNMLKLPPFDRPWAEAPSFYRELSALPPEQREELRIIEAPALVTRARHLHRNSYLRHGVETVLAFLPGELLRPPSGPYLSINRSRWWEAADADYLILHLDVRGEVERYWSSVYAPDGSAVEDSSIGAYMQRHSRIAGRLRGISKPVVHRVTAALGKPDYRDPEIAVWRLR
jgi:hypothetical protein